MSRLSALATALATSVTLAVSGMVPALAVTTLTVTVTGGGASIRGSATGPVFEFQENMAKIACHASAATLDVPTGTKKGPAPVKIGSAKTLTFSKCTGPGGLTFTGKATGLPEPFNVTSTTTASGQTSVTLTGVTVSFSGPDCSLIVSGTAEGHYDNAVAADRLGPVLVMVVRPWPPFPAASSSILTVSHVVGCLGLFSDGEQVNYKATYNLSPATLNIDSTTP